MNRMKRILTHPIPLPAWTLILLYASWVLDDVARRKYVALALLVGAFIGSYIIAATLRRRRRATQSVAHIDWIEPQLGDRKAERIYLDDQDTRSQTS